MDDDTREPPETSSTPALQDAPEVPEKPADEEAPPRHNLWGLRVTEHRPRLTNTLFAAGVAAGPLLCFAGITLSSFLPPAFATFAILASEAMMVTAPLMALLVQFLLLRGNGAAWIEGDRLIIADTRRQRVIPLSQLREGIVKQWGASAMVQLRLEGTQRYDLVMPSVEAGRSLLAATGLDGWMRRCTVLIRRETSRLNAIVIGAVLTMLLSVPALWVVTTEQAGVPVAAALALLPVAVLAWTARRLKRARDREVVVGRDAIRFTDERGSTHVVPTSTVVSAVGDKDVTLTLTSGETLTIPATGDYAEEREALVARINAVVAETRQASEGALAVLSRNGRDAKDWHGALTSLLAQENYRRLALSRDDVTAVLNDGTRGLDERVAAALALVGRERDTHSLTQVRIAAEASASEDVRTALLDVTEGRMDDDRLARMTAGRGGG